MTDDEPYGDVPRLPERIGTCHYDPDTGEYVMPGDFIGEKELRWRPAPSPTDDVTGDVASDEGDSQTGNTVEYVPEDDPRAAPQTLTRAGNVPDSGNLSLQLDSQASPATLAMAAENALLEAMAVRFDRCLAIARAKNADYAGSSDPWANFRRSELVGVPVARGILVRITDKLARISNLLDREPEVADERLTDTIDDAISYLAILGAWLDTVQSERGACDLHGDA